MTVTFDLRWGHSVLMSASWTAQTNVPWALQAGPSADQSTVL